MFPVLLSYFDLGVSYALSDRVFPAAEVAAAEIGMVGLQPALGQGIAAAAPDGVVRTWTEHAALQAHRDVMETGRRGDRDVFDAELEQLIRTHEVRRCRLTIYAVGTVLVELWFAPDVPQQFLRGLLRCFEYAGYKPEVAHALHEVAVRRIAQSLDAGTMASPLTALTRRELPPIDVDPSEQEPDGGDYREQLLLPSFTNVLVCTEPRDAEALEAALQALDPDTEPDDRETVTFEFHGRLVCGWAVNAVVARRIITPDDPGDDEAEDQVKRMLACIEIAHVFYGTCEAFERLFMGETHQQVDGYLRNTTGGRRPDDLNRLRTLALAIISLTRFSSVTETQEDQAYFAWFEEQSQLQVKRDFIREAADMLYNVSEAETQSTRGRREVALNTIVLLLTSATLLSVSADLYNFVRDQEPLIGERVDRFQVVLESVLALVLVVVVTIFLLSRPKPLRLRRAPRDEPGWEGLLDPTKPPQTGTDGGGADMTSTR